jgi:hypothetical protein
MKALEIAAIELTFDIFDDSEQVCLALDHLLRPYDPVADSVCEMVNDLHGAALGEGRLPRSWIDERGRRRWKVIMVLAREEGEDGEEGDKQEKGAERTLGRRPGHLWAIRLGRHVAESKNTGTATSPL